jgi:hypothetical protein
MEQQPGNSARSTPVKPGAAVYSAEGLLLGRVSGFTDEGFTVDRVAVDDPDALHQEEIPGQEFGEGFLMWRCSECGEMGAIEDGLPETCPNCGSPKEYINYWTED